MQNFKILLYPLLSLTLFLFVSCNEDEEKFGKLGISISPLSAEIDASAREVTFEVTTKKEWSAKTNSSSWISITKGTGNKSEKQLTISISANIDQKERIDTIYVTSGEKTAKIPIKQSGLSSIVSTTDIVLLDNAVFSINASESWSIELTDTKATPKWFDVQPKSGEAGKVNVTVSKKMDNESTDDRNAFIKVKMGNTLFYLTVTQKGRDAIILSKKKVELPPAAGKFSITVKSNIQYEVVIPSSCSWIKRDNSPTKALVEKVENFAIEANTPDGNRSGIVIIKGQNLSDTIKVYQSQLNTLLLTPDIIFAESHGGTATVELKSNVEYNTTILDNANWLRLISQSEVRTDRKSVQIDENNSTTQRVAKIVFSDRNSSLTDTLFVNQAARNSDNFTKENKYGIYGYGGDNTPSLYYTPYVDQLSSITISDKISFRLINPKYKKFYSVIDIPNIINVGDSFTIRIIQNYVDKYLYNFSLPVSVMKIENEKVWLYSSQKSIGLIIRK